MNLTVGIVACIVGPKRGRCDCGECVCNENYGGKDCRCLLSNETCIAKDGVIVHHFLVGFFAANFIRHFDSPITDADVWIMGDGRGLLSAKTLVYEFQMFAFNTMPKL